MNMELWQQIGSEVAIAIGVAFLIGVGTYVRTLKGKMHDLEKKCESYALRDSLETLKLKMKDLEMKDALQQQTIDQLNDMFPLLKQAMDILEKKKR